MLSRSLPLAACLAVLLLVAGCNRGPKTYRIPGRLVYEDGSAVTGASVVLQTKLEGQVVAARGVAAADGSFNLSTFQEGDGVVAGEHEVSISPVPVPEGSNVPKPSIPQHYWDSATSGLKTDVTPQSSEILITINRQARQ